MSELTSQESSVTDETVQDSASQCATPHVDISQSGRAQTGTAQPPATQPESTQPTATQSDSLQSAQSMGDLFPDLNLEQPIISGVAHDSSESLVTLRGVPNEPGMAAEVFTQLAEVEVNVDMIVQAGASIGTADISFTVPSVNEQIVRDVLQERHDVLGYESFEIDSEVGKVAVVGVGMKTHSGLAAKFFKSLSALDINVLMISTSEIRIAALVKLDDLNDAVRALHTAYGLNASQVEAVVYGGTGR